MSKHFITFISNCILYSYTLVTTVVFCTETRMQLHENCNKNEIIEIGLFVTAVYCEEDNKRLQELTLWCPRRMIS